MALPFTDTFNGTAGTDIHTYNANWVENNLTLAIATPAPGIISGGTNAVCHWAGDAFNNDQYGQVTWGSNFATGAAGPTVRVDAAANTYYCFRFSSATQTTMFKFVAGAFTSLGNSATGHTNAAGDIITLVVAGTTLNGYINGILQIGPITDASIASGSAGMACNAPTGTVLQISSFAGGNGNPIPQGQGIGAVLTSGASTPSTVCNGAGASLSITSPTVTSKLGQPTPIAFCDNNGNVLTITGATVGSEIASPIPVVLCTPAGKVITPTITLTSNGSSIVVTASKTGVNLGQPVPVCISDQNGAAYLTTGFSAFGVFVANPVPIVLTSKNGNILTLLIGN